jgi:hypothetical protein
MISPDDSRNTIDCGDYYIIQPQFEWWEGEYLSGKKMQEGFPYTSDSNPVFLSVEEMKKLVDEHIKALEAAQCEYKTGEENKENENNHNRGGLNWTKFSAPA